jgi:hypothetical protein
LLENLKDRAALKKLGVGGEKTIKTRLKEIGSGNLN